MTDSMGITEGTRWLGSNLNGALLSDDEQYRYRLWRTPRETLESDRLSIKRRLLFVMLNPSTADHHTDDPTIRKCVGFARRWGFGVVEVVNLFAFRATDPRDLRSVDDPVGPDNDLHIELAAFACQRIVLAWGCRPEHMIRARAHQVRALLDGMSVRGSMYAIEERDSGYRHPLMAAYSTQPVTLAGSRP